MNKYWHALRQLHRRSKTYSHLCKSELLRIISRWEKSGQGKGRNGWSWKQWCWCIAVLRIVSLGGRQRSYSAEPRLFCQMTSTCLANSSSLLKWSTIISVVFLGGGGLPPTSSIVAAASEQWHWCIWCIVCSKHSPQQQWRQQSWLLQTQTPSSRWFGRRQGIFDIASSCPVHSRTNSVSATTVERSEWWSISRATNEPTRSTYGDERAVSRTHIPSESRVDWRSKVV
jgi:hypothetical protein